MKSVAKKINNAARMLKSAIQRKRYYVGSHMEKHDDTTKLQSEIEIKDQYSLMEYTITGDQSRVIPRNGTLNVSISVPLSMKNCSQK
jgi:hypothetical protein